MKPFLHLAALSMVAGSVAIATASETAFEPAGFAGRDPFALPSTATGDLAARSPLLRYSLADLKLVATVHGIDRPRALIEDPEGLGFVIGVGCVVGAERAKVTSVDPGRVIIEPVEGAAPIVLLVNREDAESSVRR